MDTITVNKNDLLHTLRENRDAHRDTFLTAQDAYRTAVIAELDRMLHEAKAGMPIKRAITLPVPEDHTEDFDTAIQMLEWDTGDVVELTHREFQQYVQNKWGWLASFAANTQSYLAQS